MQSIFIYRTKHTILGVLPILSNYQAKNFIFDGNTICSYNLFNIQMWDIDKVLTTNFYYQKLDCQQKSIYIFYMTFWWIPKCNKWPIFCYIHFVYLHSIHHIKNFNIYSTKSKPGPEKPGRKRRGKAKEINIYGKHCRLTFISF